MTVIFPVKDRHPSIELVIIIHTVKEDVIELKDREDRYYYQTKSMKEAHYYMKSVLAGPPIIVN